MESASAPINDGNVSAVAGVQHPADQSTAQIRRWATEKLAFYESQIAAWEKNGVDHFGAARADHQARACVLRELLRQFQQGAPASRAQDAPSTHRELIARSTAMSYERTDLECDLLVALLAQERATRVERERLDLAYAQFKRAEDQRRAAYREVTERAEKAEQATRRAEQERDAIAEELESNRRCNLHTWKERAEAAESQLQGLWTLVDEIKDEATNIEKDAREELEDGGAIYFARGRASALREYHAILAARLPPRTTGEPPQTEPEIPA